jgi:hypothetical protein
MLQRMPAAEMLLHWLDLHQEPQLGNWGDFTNKPMTGVGF